MPDYTETATFPDHKDLPSGGPWADEPDKLVWIDETTGLDCMIHRNLFGTLCGYVGIPQEHPWHGVHYGDCTKNLPECDDDVYCDHEPKIALDVHGGITYSAACQPLNDDGSGICHIPQDGRPDDVWWFGFDCNHSGDLAPGSPSVLPGVYRNIAYVEAEIVLLAEQLAAVTE